MSRQISYLARLEEVIIELRGNGVVMSVFELETETLELLKQKADKFGVDLTQAWLDPFFWHPKEMTQLKSKINKKEEMRGLLPDDVSFLEVRIKGKRRKKYLVKELLGDGQLFPMVDVAENPLSPRSTQSEVIELVEATGSIAVYRCPFNKSFNLNEMRLTKFSSGVGTYFLISLPTTNHFHLEGDDFLVRRQFGICSPQIK